VTKVPVAQTLIAYGLAPIRNRWGAHPASFERYRYSGLTLAWARAVLAPLDADFKASRPQLRRVALYVQMPGDDDQRTGRPTTRDCLKKSHFLE